MAIGWHGTVALALVAASGCAGARASRPADGLAGGRAQRAAADTATQSDVSVRAAGDTLEIRTRDRGFLHVWVAESEFLQAQAAMRPECDLSRFEAGTPGADGGDASDGTEEDLAYARSACTQFLASTTVEAALRHFVSPIPPDGIVRIPWAGKIPLGAPEVNELRVSTRVLPDALETKERTLAAASGIRAIAVLPRYRVPDTFFAPGHAYVSALGLAGVSPSVLLPTAAGYAWARIEETSRRALAEPVPVGWHEERVFAFPSGPARIFVHDHFAVVVHGGRTEARRVEDGLEEAVLDDAAILSAVCSNDRCYALLRLDALSRGRWTSGYCGAGIESTLVLVEIAPASVRVLGKELLASCVDSIEVDPVEPRGRILAFPRQRFSDNPASKDCVVYDPDEPARPPQRRASCP
jgi:hypothetical protein